MPLDERNTYTDLLLAGLAAAGGGLSSRAGTTTQSSTLKNLTQGGSQVHTAYAPEYQDIYTNALRNFSALSNQDPNLSGYTATGISDINRLSRLQQQNATENLAARGIYGPAAAASLNNIDAQRFGNIARFRQGIPLLSRQIQEDTLGKLVNAFTAAPKDVYTSNFGQDAQDFSGQTTAPGNVAGGALSSLATTLAGLYGINSGSNSQTGDGGGGWLSKLFKILLGAGGTSSGLSIDNPDFNSIILPTLSQGTRDVLMQQPSM